VGEFRQKPVVVEARRWDGTQRDATNLVTWIHHNGMLAYYESVDGEGRIVINTLTGPDYASPQDWVVKGVLSEFRPVRDEIFQLTHEGV
jgi:hypothetical protein